MSSLIPEQREYSRVPHLLIREVRGFAASPEYKSLENHDLKLPGVVCGAFARFLVRLQQCAIEGTVSEDEAQSLAASYQVVEQLSSSYDPYVVNAVVVEIFENLDCEPHVLEAIKARLEKASRQLYEKWIG